MNRIKQLRKKKGASIDDVANAISVSRATANNYETGKHEPKLATWQKLADYFGVNVPYLQGFDVADTFKDVFELDKDNNLSLTTNGKENYQSNTNILDLQNVIKIAYAVNYLNENEDNSYELDRLKQADTNTLRTISAVSQAVVYLSLAQHKDFDVESFDEGIEKISQVYNDYIQKRMDAN